MRVRTRLRIVAVLALAVIPAGTALASNPTGAPTMTASIDRYRPTITFAYPAPVTVQAANVSVHRVGSTAPLPFDLTVNGGSVSIELRVTLSAATSYRATVLPDGDSTADSKLWKTRGVPAHPTLHVKVITAIDPAAVDDLVRRFDRTNLLAPPKVGDLVDVSAATGRALTAADLTGYQAALVVTANAVGNRPALAQNLAAFANAGHGVVTAGASHWSAAGPAWTTPAAITSGLSTTWDHKWSMYPIEQPGVVAGGTMVAATRVAHFLTVGLTHFQVLGQSSGECVVQDHVTGLALARLNTSTGCPAGDPRQILLAERQIGRGRIVDLGFNPWSNAVAGGGFDPTVSAGGALVARSLWWATNKIPPTGTHFTYRPPNPAHYNTIWFTVAGSDPDPFGHSLHYQFKVNRGSWKLAAGTTLLLRNLRAGYYTVSARTVDSGGNVDPHPAVYRVRVPPGAGT